MRYAYMYNVLDTAHRGYYSKVALISLSAPYLRLLFKGGYYIRCVAIVLNTVIINVPKLPPSITNISYGLQINHHHK